VNFRTKAKKSYEKLFLWQRNYIDRYILRKDIKRRFLHSPNIPDKKVDPAYLQESKEFLIKNFNGYNCILWHQYYAAFTKNKAVNYIPTDLYLTKIEPALNNFETNRGIADKIGYDIYFPKKNLPETIYKIINNRYFTAENNFVPKTEALQTIQNEKNLLVLKPAIESGGGKNVIIEPAENIIKRLQHNKSYFSGSFVLQKRIVQHAQLTKMHAQSVNTYRIMTARVGSEIVVLSSYFRIGQGSAKLDNGQSGGLMCRIFDNGTLDKIAYDKNLNSTEKHPDSGIVFENFMLPNYQKAKMFCLENHQRFIRFTFISWDIAIQENGEAIFIEFNLKRQSIHGHQVLNGPIFGLHTNYFAEKYRQAVINK
jgi:hypothetical protein